MGRLNIAPLPASDCSGLLENAEVARVRWPGPEDIGLAPGRPRRSKEVEVEVT